jgi:hypothetical protein
MGMLVAGRKLFGARQFRGQLRWFMDQDRQVLGAYPDP